MEVTGRVQVHHAELDFQGDDSLTQLEAELKAGVNGTQGLWETAKYAKCEHGWTEPDSAVYRARAAVQAHKSSFEFFEMALGDEDPSADPFPSMPFCRSHNHSLGVQSRPPSAPAPSMMSDFEFTAAYVNSTRQWGKCLHILVKYRYRADQYLDYRPMREAAISLLKAPTAELPVDAKWEEVNRELVRGMVAQYSVAAIVSQVVVRHEQTKEISEPGTHGSIISAGDLSMPPSPFSLVDSFKYDCTTQEPAIDRWR